VLTFLARSAGACAKIDTDERFHIRLDLLRLQLKETVVTGRFPFCIVGIAGTTSTGVIDPLPELAEIARANNCWFTWTQHTAAGWLFPTNRNKAGE